MHHAQLPAMGLRQTGLIQPGRIGPVCRQRHELDSYTKGRVTRTSRGRVLACHETQYSVFGTHRATLVSAESYLVLQSYSQRNASVGSVLAARQAGM